MTSTPKGRVIASSATSAEADSPRANDPCVEAPGFLAGGYRATRRPCVAGFDQSASAAELDGPSLRAPCVRGSLGGLPDGAPSTWWKASSTIMSSGSTTSATCPSTCRCTIGSSSRPAGLACCWSGGGSAGRGPRDWIQGRLLPYSRLTSPADLSSRSPMNLVCRR
jgi:hypothetical protein